MPRNLDERIALLNRQPSFDPRGLSPILDKYLLLGIAVIGFVGCLYLFRSGTTIDVSRNVHSIENHDHSIALFSNKFNAANNHLVIKGSLEENVNITFSLKNDPGNKKFLLDMGNGDQRVIGTNPLNYSYLDGGKFNLQLKEIKKNGLVTIYTKAIDICKNRKLSLR